MSGGIDRIDAVLFVDRLAQDHTPAANAPLDEVVEPAGAHHVASQSTPWTSPGCEIVILV
jgi:hypothetical protein